jgi:methyltransferase-like protein
MKWENDQIEQLVTTEKVKTLLTALEVIANGDPISVGLDEITDVARKALDFYENDDIKQELDGNIIKKNVEKIMNTFTLLEKDWKTFDQEKPPVETPVWLKLSNGTVALAVYLNNGLGSIGWWRVSYTYSDGFFASTSEAYLAKDAKWQPCKLF